LRFITLCYTIFHYIRCTASPHLSLYTLYCIDSSFIIYVVLHRLIFHYIRCTASPHLSLYTLYCIASLQTETSRKLQKLSILQELGKCGGNCDSCKCKRPGVVPSNRSGVVWYAPTSLVQLYAILKKHQQHNGKLISGNTAKGK